MPTKLEAEKNFNQFFFHVISKLVSSKFQPSSGDSYFTSKQIIYEIQPFGFSRHLVKKQKSRKERSSGWVTCDELQQCPSDWGNGWKHEQEWVPPLCSSSKSPKLAASPAAPPCHLSPPSSYYKHSDHKNAPFNIILFQNESSYGTHSFYISTSTKIKIYMNNYNIKNKFIYIVYIKLTQNWQQIWWKK